MKVNDDTRACVSSGPRVVIIHDNDPRQLQALAKDGQSGHHDIWTMPPCVMHDARCTMSYRRLGRGKSDAEWTSGARPGEDVEQVREYRHVGQPAEGCPGYSSRGQEPDNFTSLIFATCASSPFFKALVIDD